MQNRFIRTIQSSYTDDEGRRIVLFNLMNILLAVISFIMTIVNVMTGEFLLMIVTAAFSALCIANFLLTKINIIKIEYLFYIFSLESMILLIYFVVSGTPDGFSVLWTLLVPALGIAIFGMRIGIGFSACAFVMIIFFFWLPAGKEILHYAYSETFMLRFPFVYICLFFASLYLESIRLGAYNKLKETEQTARYLYRHDALTGLYSRHAFSEELKRLFAQPSENKAVIVLIDIDDFKRINDEYGHNTGDVVLKTIADIIRKNTCDHCICCRWGGEEFLILMQCTHDPFEIFENIRKSVEATEISYDNQKLHVTISIGIAVANTLSQPQLNDFINLADTAMYKSKAEGKNKITQVFMEI